jgi:hypothetical protein
MEIQIKRNLNESSLGINKMQWKLLLKRYYVWITTTFILGAILIAVNYKNDSSVGLGLGMGLDFFAFLFLLNLFRANEKSVDNIKKALSKLSETEQVVTMKINESKLIYESNEMKIEYNWGVFRNYKIYKDSIFLIVSSYLDSFVIRKIDLTDNEFTELSNFVVKFLPENK